MDLSVPLDSNSNINLTQHCNKYLARSLTGGKGIGEIGGLGEGGRRESAKRDLWGVGGDQ